MCFLLFLFATNLTYCSATPQTDFEQYLQFIKDYPHLGEAGNYKEGKIEIVLEKNTVKRIEEAQAKRFMREGETKEIAHKCAKIGIVARDRYWVWIRDAVIFPSGAFGTFDRIVKTKALDKAKFTSVAILPVTQDGKIVLNVLYRHAVRGWALEIPRGGLERGETVLEAAKRELKEETGLIGNKFIHLGEIAPDSGTVASIVPCYFTRIEKKGVPSQDYTEAIVDSVFFTKEEVKDALVKGFVEIEINKKKTKVMIKDSYLAYTLLLAEKKKLI